MVLRMFFAPIRHYFKTLNRYEFRYEILLPLVISLLFYFFFLKDGSFGISKFTNFIFTFIAILIGFSITTITLLTASSNRNIEGTQAYETDRKLGKNRLSLYQLTLVTFTYCLFMEFVILLFNLSFVLLFHLFPLNGRVNIYYAINIFLIAHVILLLYRNITCLYFIFIKDDHKK